jgi:aminopeptidase
VGSINNGDALLGMRGTAPDLLKGYDSELVSTIAKTYAKHAKPISEKIVINAVQWLGICPPTPDWAKVVFPDLSEEEALNKLWEAVIQACRLNDPDPVKSWRQNLDSLKERALYMTAKRYQKIHFKGPGTDLEVGLPEGHLWIGGWDDTLDGVQFSANIPTEEVFTLPHRDRVNGTVRATMPLSYQGRLIEDFQLRFENGKVVEYSAKKEQEALQGILETDANAAYLGEVALVPHSSPISQLGLVFLNTLYDENASNHLALGKAYRFNLEGGTEMTEEEFLGSGGNDSLVHVDFMFGSAEMDVDGILEDGTTEGVMRGGEWAFEV